MRLHYRNIWIILLAATLLAPFGIRKQASAARSDDILAAIQRRHAEVYSLSADYTRVTRTPSMEDIFQSGSKHTASGQLKFKKPAKMRLDQSTPRSENMVTDGRTVWWYIRNKNLVRRYSNVNVYGELKPLLDFLSGLSSLKGHFSVRVEPAGQQGMKYHVLYLTRTTHTSGPPNITVWFHPRNYTLAGFRLHAVTGETTNFSLRNVRFNPNLPDGYFRFQIPAGAQVEDVQQ